MKKPFVLTIALTLVLGSLLSACQTSLENEMVGSGTLSAVQVSVIPEVNGKVLSIEVQEGDQVQQGDVLIKLDDELIAAQTAQAQAGKQAADAGLEAANQQLAYALAQYDLAVQSARYQTSQQREQAWAAPVAEDFRPNWYFEKEEQIEAANAVIEATLENLQTRKANLEKELNATANQEFIEIEQNLAQAQARLSIAEATLAKAQTSQDQMLINAAESMEDLAKSEFDTTFKKYNGALTTNSAETILEARAQLAAAQSTYEFALDNLMSLQTGEDALQVRVAKTGVDQAETAIKQAEGALAQAEAALLLANLQLDRTQIKAPIAGTVIYSNVEVGDMAIAGGSVMTIADLNQLQLFVYVPETWYGQIVLGDTVDISVDSFPAESFRGEVVRIADEAEFTPRNVQSSDGRATTVYAIKVLVPNPSLRLKPGMPADVDFGK